jgi:hypothetical protein
MTHGMPSPRTVVLSIAALLFALVLAVAATTVGSAQSSRSFEWNRYDVTIQVEEGGSLLVTERFEAAFSGSPAFTYGYADIPTGRTEGIDVVSLVEVTMDGSVEYEKVDAAGFSRQAGTYSVIQEAENVHIEYGFSAATNEQRTFVLSYRANLALRVYGEGTERTEQIWWNAISQEVTDIAPVRTATLTIVLPKPVSQDQVVLGEDTIGPAADHTQDGKVWRWEESYLSSGDDFIVRMQFPAVAAAPVPSWQTADDCERQGFADSLFRYLVAEFARSLGFFVDDPCTN